MTTAAASSQRVIEQAFSSNRQARRRSAARHRWAPLDLHGTADGPGSRASEKACSMTRWLLAAAVVIVALAHLLIPWAPLVELRRASPDTAWLLLSQIRLPRTLLALGYGAVLGTVGAALQALFANPLA